MKKYEKYPLYYENRYDSFIFGNWPFVNDSNYLAQPDSLASAGFFYLPQQNHFDNVKCAYCSKELDQWCPEDDPFVIHYRHSETCIWARAHCKQRISGKPGADGKFIEWPTDTVENCEKLLLFINDWETRFKTFGKFWPFPRELNNPLSPKKLAQAGFYYAPDRAGDDTVLCGFCNCTLNYWEPNDDPM
ncbi:Protein bir1 [Smittium culicis]|uniref:Protein bir1 n=1 Tax=Smittium culicis TaxID=133412 RepID=A0A1R1XY49_9FUNG|nr:Protein bir1 [Smittium culicis]